MKEMCFILFFFVEGPLHISQMALPQYNFLRNNYKKWCYHIHVYYFVIARGIPHDHFKIKVDYINQPIKIRLLLAKLRV